MCSTNSVCTWQSVHININSGWIFSARIHTEAEQRMKGNEKSDAVVTIITIIITLLLVFVFNFFELFIETLGNRTLSKYNFKRNCICTHYAHCTIIEYLYGTIARIFSGRMSMFFFVYVLFVLIKFEF